MKQETLLRANAELYGTLTIIGGVLEHYVDHEMDNGRQPNANLGVAAGLATKVLNAVEKLFDEAVAPEIEPPLVGGFTEAELEGGAARVWAAINRDRPEHEARMTPLGLVIHAKSGFNHPFATRQFCRLCDDEQVCTCPACATARLATE